MTHEELMRLAMAEAEKGRGRTHPNPIVGAVIARNGRAISVGHHRKAGLPHAEIEALRKGSGSDLYVTLEPCNHHGRTPPCTQAILRAGIKRVFYGSRDPNAAAKGGARFLRRHGVEVRQLLVKECDAQNEQWLKFIATGKPWVVLKAAITLDGKLTARERWISSEESRRLVHVWRNQLDAVLVGSGTVRADSPKLTVRAIRNGRDPVKVILGRARLADGLNVSGPIESVLRELGDRGMTSVLVEGGAKVFTQFLDAGAWDELRLFIAPKISGPEGLSWTNAAPSAARIVSTELSGADTLLFLRP